jgi:hypothetical protein
MPRGLTGTVFAVRRIVTARPTFMHWIKRNVLASEHAEERLVLGHRTYAHRPPLRDRPPPKSQPSALWVGTADINPAAAQLARGERPLRHRRSARAEDRPIQSRAGAFTRAARSLRRPRKPVATPADRPLKLARTSRAMLAN